MSNLTPAPSSRSGAKDAGASKPRVLLLRDRVRVERRDETLPRAGLRLGVVSAAAAGTVLGVWTLGYLGFRLGVAELLGVPELLAEPGEGLATGTLMLLRTPTTIFRAGLVQPLWLVIGFASIVLPAALLPAARPIARGGPRPLPVVTGLSAAGAVLAMLAATLLVAWIVSPLRESWIGPLPHSRSLGAAWMTNLTVAAGVDLFAAAGAAIWGVLVLRLAISTWLRWLAGVMVYFALAVTLVGASISNACAAHLDRDRSLVHLGRDEALLLGYTRQHVVLLRVVDDIPVVALEEPGKLVVVGRRSIGKMVSE